jgi:hypothetical protein
MIDVQAPAVDETRAREFEHTAVSDSLGLVSVIA